MKKKFECLPEHIAIIMDGNGRWAKERGLKRTEGHKVGAKVFEEICEYCAEIGIKHVTFYAFSTENWKRSKIEVTAIMNLFRGYLDRMQERVLENEQAGYRIRFLGARDGMPKDLVSRMDDVEKKSADKDRININIAVNYGSRDEIVRGVKDIVREIQSGKLSVDDINEELISSHLYTAGQPDPDLIIRPSGEYRLSNYLMWQAAYSEIYIDDVLWPDYTPECLDRAIEEYSKRNRRFGGV